MAAVHYYTEEGLRKLKEELHSLKTKSRQEIAKAIEEAREQGDLRENAEYKAAKEAQKMLEMKIAELEEHLKDARIIDESQIDLSRVSILTTVKVKNLKTNAITAYSLVPGKESNLAAGKISVESPVGKGLLGKAVGEIAEIVVPAGKLNFEILEITRS